MSSYADTPSAYPMAPSTPSSAAPHPPLATTATSSPRPSSSTGSDTDDAPPPPPPPASSTIAARLGRPRTSSRRPSHSIIIPKTLATTQSADGITYAADDARGMSPRRASADIEKLGESARRTLKHQAAALQASLAALAERIDVVKGDHDKLESENRLLQDYIGGLTRGISAGTRPDWAAAGSAKPKPKGKSKR